MWLLPTRGRPELAQRVFSIAPPTAKGAVLVDDDEIEVYSHLTLPKNWFRLILPRTTLSQKFNAAFEVLNAEPFYGLLNDDMLPTTPGWDTALPETAGPWGIAWADDELNHRIGASAFGGELVRTLGWICQPTQKHFFLDDAQELIARELGIGKPCLHIKIPHLHFTAGKAPYDQTYKNRPSHSADRLAFENWKLNEWPATKERLSSAFSGRVESMTPRGSLDCKPASLQT